MVMLPLPVAVLEPMLLTACVVTMGNKDKVTFISSNAMGLPAVAKSPFKVTINCVVVGYNCILRDFCCQPVASFTILFVPRLPPDDFCSTITLAPSLLSALYISAERSSVTFPADTSTLILDMSMVCVTYCVNAPDDNRSNI